MKELLGKRFFRFGVSRSGSSRVLQLTEHRSSQCRWELSEVTTFRENGNWAMLLIPPVVFF